MEALSKILNKETGNNWHKTKATIGDPYREAMGTLIEDAEQETKCIRALSNAKVEWIDGTPALHFVPSELGKTFAGFPYILLLDEDSDLTWNNNEKEVEKFRERTEQ